MKLVRLVAAAATVSGLLAGEAHAYVRTLTSAGKPMFWPTASVSVLLYAGDPPRYVTSDQLIGAIHAAAATWSKPGVTCTSMQLSVSQNNQSDAPVGNDQVNRITFRTDVWAKKPCNPAMEGDCVAYDTRALALTSVFARTSTGEIIDADMELNAVGYRWDDVVEDPPKTSHPADSQSIQDVQNVVTHELGHLIGFDHNCYDPLSNPNGPPLDNTGQPVPNCATASAAVMAATMFASAMPGDISKRDLADDDTMAVCDTYPPGYAGIPGLGGSGGGCSIASAATSRPLGFVSAAIGLALAALVRIRARRRR